jgi:hypothetical protein
MAELSFPYPSLLAAPRARGKGCVSCVHNTYCPALYWLRRGSNVGGIHLQPLDDDRLGLACGSWSDNAADIVKTVTDADLEVVERMYMAGIGSEANRGED